MIRRVPLLSPPLSSAHSSSFLPKKPRNPYMIYVADNYKSVRDTHPPNTLSQTVLKALGESWQGLSTTEKSKYTKQSELQNAEYQRYFQTAPLGLMYDTENKKDQKFIMKKFTELGRIPKKPPMSGYGLFVSRQKCPATRTPQQHIAHCAALYQQLTDVQKGRLRAEVAIMKDRYKGQMEKLMNA